MGASLNRVRSKWLCTLRRASSIILSRSVSGKRSVLLSATIKCGLAEFGQNQTFRRLCLPSLDRIHDQQHDVNDLCSTDNGTNQTGVSGAIDQRNLELILVRKGLLDVVWDLVQKEARETEIKRHATFTTLLGLVECRCTEQRGQRLDQRRFARVHMPEHAHVNVQNVVARLINCCCCCCFAVTAGSG